MRPPTQFRYPRSSYFDDLAINLILVGNGVGLFLFSVDESRFAGRHSSLVYSPWQPYKRWIFVSFLFRGANLLVLIDRTSPCPWILRIVDVAAQPGSRKIFIVELSRGISRGRCSGSSYALRANSFSILITVSASTKSMELHACPIGCVHRD